jgi:hypothetical protein
MPSGEAPLSRLLIAKLFHWNRKYYVCRHRSAIACKITDAEEGRIASMTSEDLSRCHAPASSAGKQIKPVHTLGYYKATEEVRVGGARSDLKDDLEESDEEKCLTTAISLCLHVSESERCFMRLLSFGFSGSESFHQLVGRRPLACLLPALTRQFPQRIVHPLLPIGT